MIHGLLSAVATVIMLLTSACKSTTERAQRGSAVEAGQSSDTASAFDAAPVPHPKSASSFQLPPGIERLRVLIEPMAALSHEGDLVSRRACEHTHWHDARDAIERFAPPPGGDKAWWLQQSNALDAQIVALAKGCSVGDLVAVRTNVDNAARTLATMATPKMATMAVLFPPVIERLRVMIEPLAALHEGDPYVGGKRACEYKQWDEDSVGIERYAPPAGVDREWWSEQAEQLGGVISELAKGCSEKGDVMAQDCLDDAAEILAIMATPKMADDVAFPPALEAFRVVVERIAALPRNGDHIAKGACTYAHWQDHAVAIAAAAPPAGVDLERWNKEVFEIPGILSRLDKWCAQLKKENPHAKGMEQTRAMGLDGVSLAKGEIDFSSRVLARLATILREPKR